MNWSLVNVMQEIAVTQVRQHANIRHASHNFGHVTTGKNASKLAP